MSAAGGTSCVSYNENIKWLMKPAPIGGAHAETTAPALRFAGAVIPVANELFRLQSTGES
jgi:hypothetical protein